MIELMSALNLEDFQMNQWIFLIDSYGIKLDFQSQQKPQQLSADHDGFQMLDKADSGQGGIFQPSILGFMPASSIITFHDQTPSKSPFQDSDAEVDYYLRNNMFSKQIESRKSSIQVDRRDYDHESVLESFAFQLQNTLAELNTERTEIDRQNFEALIEKDFIEFDSK